MVAKQSILQVRMDSDLKQSAEDLYRRMGTSLAEAVRIFARQSVEENAMPFVIHVPPAEADRRLGLADGKYDIPDDIDADNAAIAEMFGVSA